MNLNKLVVAFAVLVVLTLAPSAAKADDLNFGFVPTTYTAAAGSIVTLRGTFVNGNGAIAFTGYGANLQGGLSLSPNGDLGSQPFDLIPGLASGQTLGPVDLFRVMIAAGTPNGTVFTFAQNSFDIVYQPSAGNEVQLTENFQITVQNAPTGTPEPATMVLLGTGLTGLWAARKRRRHQLAQE